MQKTVFPRSSSSAESMSGSPPPPSAAITTMASESLSGSPPTISSSTSGAICSTFSSSSMAASLEEEDKFSYSGQQEGCPVCVDGMLVKHLHYGGRACYSCRGFFRYNSPMMVVI